MHLGANVLWEGTPTVLVLGFPKHVWSVSATRVTVDNDGQACLLGGSWGERFIVSGRLSEQVKHPSLSLLWPHLVAHSRISLDSHYHIIEPLYLPVCHSAVVSTLGRKPGGGGSSPSGKLFQVYLGMVFNHLGGYILFGVDCVTDWQCGDENVHVLPPIWPAGLHGSKWRPLYSSLYRSNSNTI